MRYVLILVAWSLFANPFDISFNGKHVSIPSTPRETVIPEKQNEHFFGSNIQPLLVENNPSILRALETEDFILGYFNPDTVYVIDYDTIIYNRIILTGNARLEIRDCDFRFRGDIFLLENSVMQIEDCSMTIFQDFDYEYNLRVLDSSYFQIHNTRLNSNGFPIGVGIAGVSHFDMSEITMDMSFITFGAYGSCSLGISNTFLPGEIVVLEGDPLIHLQGIDSVLVWFGFPIGSSGILDLDFGDHIEEFIFPTPDFSGIDYTLILEDVDGLMKAAMISDSTDVIIRDTDLRALGMIFKDGISDTLVGFANGIDVPAFEPEIEGRNLRIEDSRINTWNFYCLGNSNIVLQNSIFGELLAEEESNAELYNSFCDGSGGHLGANGNSVFNMFFTSSMGHVLLEGNSTTFIVLSSLMGWGQLVLQNSAVAVAFRSTLVNPVIVQDSSALLVADIVILPVPRADEVLNIMGTAKMITALHSLLTYEGYSFHYNPISAPEEVTYLTERITDTVDDDLLLSWDTHGMEVGEYTLSFTYYFSWSGELDSINFENYVRIFESEGLCEHLNVTSELLLYPNPVNSTFEIAYPGLSQWIISDEMGRIVLSGKKSIIDFSEFPSGQYYITVNNEKSSAKASLINIK